MPLWEDSQLTVIPQEVPEDSRWILAYLFPRMNNLKLSQWSPLECVLGSHTLVLVPRCTLTSVCVKFYMPLFNWVTFFFLSSSIPLGSRGTSPIALPCLPNWLGCQWCESHPWPPERLNLRQNMAKYTSVFLTILWCCAVIPSGELRVLVGKQAVCFCRLQGRASHPELQVHPQAALHLLQARGWSHEELPWVSTLFLSVDLSDRPCYVQTRHQWGIENNSNVAQWHCASFWKKKPKNQTHIWMWDRVHWVHCRKVGPSQESEAKRICHLLRG